MSFTTQLQLIAEMEAALQRDGIDAFKAVCNGVKWEAAFFAILKEKILEETHKDYWWKDIDAMIMSMWDSPWVVTMRENFMMLKRVGIRLSDEEIYARCDESFTKRKEYGASKK